MKLVSAHVTNYRNIIDSDRVEIGQSTCLVGKNEAGKTAFLKALEGLRSTDGSFKQYGKVGNYPRRYLADYAARHGGIEAVVVTTEWVMSDDDLRVVQAELGSGSLNNKTVTISKSYEQEGSSWIVPFNYKKCLSALISHHKLTAEEKSVLDDVEGQLSL